MQGGVIAHVGVAPPPVELSAQLPDGIGDGPVEEICPGDVIWTPPGERHWHGATPTTAMTHIAIQEQLNGTTANWMEKVSDEQYPGK